MTINQPAIKECRGMSGKDNLSPKKAQVILGLKFAQDDLDRINALAARARDGTLTKEEDEELENYLKAGQQLSLLKSKARQILKKGAGGA
jgi:hypothetical protein